MFRRDEGGGFNAEDAENAENAKVFGSRLQTRTLFVLCTLGGEKGLWIPTAARMTGLGHSARNCSELRGSAFFAKLGTDLQRRNQSGPANQSLEGLEIPC